MTHEDHWKEIGYEAGYKAAYDAEYARIYHELIADILDPETHALLIWHGLKERLKNTNGIEKVLESHMRDVAGHLGDLLRQHPVKG